LGGSADG